MSDKRPLYLNIDLTLQDKYNLSPYDLIVMAYLNFRFNNSPVLTIDNESLSEVLKMSVSTIKRCLEQLKKHNLIRVKTSYSPELNKNKREIVKVLLEPLVSPVKSSPEFQKHYKYNKKSDNRVKVLKEPTINNNINNIKTIKNNDKTSDKKYYIKIKSGNYESIVPVSLETYNNTSPELRYN